MSNALIERIAAKVMVDYKRLSIVSNPDGLLTQEPVQKLLYQQFGIEVIHGANLQLRIHFELDYKAHKHSRYLYVSDNISAILPDMRREAYVCTFKVGDIFPLFSDKSLLEGLPFELLEDIFLKVDNKKVSFQECSLLLDEVVQEQEEKRQKSKEFCLEQLRSITPDWCDQSKTIKTISDVVVKAVRSGIYSHIEPEINNLNSSFQDWVNREYFSTPASSHLIWPKNVNKILPHLVSKHDRNEKVALLVVDGFSYWQYQVLRNVLHNEDIETQDGSTLAWIPTITKLSRQAIFRGNYPKLDYDQNPNNEKKLWNAFWENEHFSSFEVQYISDKDTFAINDGVKRLAVVTVEMDEKMHSSTDNKDLLSLTENWSLRYLPKIKEILEAGFHLYLTTDHGNVLSHGWRLLSQEEKIFLYKDGSRGCRHLIYNSVNADEQQKFFKDNSSVSLLNHDNWLVIRNDNCFASNGKTMITHGGSHFFEVIIPFIKIVVKK